MNALAAGQMLNPSGLDVAVELGGPAVAVGLLVWAWLSERRKRSAGRERPP